MSEPTEVFVSVGGHRIPDGEIPGEWSPAKRSRARQLRELWATHMAAAPSEDDDVELFYEQAARLDAVLAVVNAEHVWVPEHMNNQLARNLVTGEVRSFGDLHETARRIGAIYETELRTPQFNVGNYARSAVIRDNAAREMWCTGGDEDTIEALEQLRDRGVERGLVKLTVGKHPLAPIDLRGNLRSQLYGQFGYDFERINPARQAFIVQERARVEYEYRLFVVDGQIVTGAGNIAAHTPLDNLAQVSLSPFMVRDRGYDLTPIDYREDHWAMEDAPTTTAPAREVEDRPGHATAFAQAAQPIVDAIAAEGLLPRDYSLDMADIDGKIGVVEMNELSNSGLYASDPKAMVRAILQAPRLDWWRPMPAAQRVHSL